MNPYQPPTSGDPQSIAPEGDPVLKDPRRLGTLALVAISAQCILSGARYLMPMDYEWVQRIRNGIICALVLSIILFFLWLHRVAANAARINPRADIRPGWCIGCYFIPFVNWVLPCTTMRAIIQETFVARPSSGLQSIAIVWWLSFQIRGIVQTKWFEGPIITIIWLVCSLAAWICVTILITRISRRQADFRWSDLPVAQRLPMIALNSHRSPPPPSGAPIPPRRIPLQPVPLAEQSRLLSQYEATDPSSPGETENMSKPGV